MWRKPEPTGTTNITGVDILAAQLGLIVREVSGSPSD